MAPKKAPLADDLASTINANDAELEQAIDDLRGVLKQDATGPSTTDFGMDFAQTGESDPLAAFGGDFGSGTDTGFGGDFGTTEEAPFQDGGFAGGEFGVPELADATAAPRPGSALEANLNLIMDIPIDLQIVLGSSQMPVSGLMNLTEGATIALDRRIGEPVEIMVNGRTIGRGEITVLENDDTRFGVKLIEVKSTSKI
ncbi:flagellar motor switch protein FliN [Mycoplana ramosa]|uniref:Flagellar motor switch protein FliN n=1 Tax=Mycoplana ramosa TaxID=40837 RepID=A0ABW3YWT0_MYCRA